MLTTFLTIPMSIVLSTSSPFPLGGEVGWKPIVQLRGAADQIEILTKDGSRTTNAIIVTGLAAANPQLEEYIPDAEPPEPFIRPHSDPVYIDVQRQVMRVNGSRAATPKWETMTLETLVAVLEEVEEYDSDELPASRVSPVFTMPLPHRKGSWPDSISHPGLNESHKLVRVIDTTVEPGHIYRYRVRIEYGNPGFSVDADPFVRSSPTCKAPWCVPCPAVSIP